MMFGVAGAREAAQSHGGRAGIRSGSCSASLGEPSDR